MSKRFRFLSYLGLASVCTASYGTPYPSLGDIESNLNLNAKEGFGVVVEKVFKDVYQQAEASSFKKSGFEDLKLIGEENGSLTLSKNFGFKDYKPEDYRDWQWRFDTIYGFFSCTVQGMSVFNGETLRKAVEASETDRLGKTMLTRADTRRITEIVKICRVLLSEKFAKELLTEPLLQALYDNKDAAYSCFDVKFFQDEFEENAFRFDVVYSQTVKEKERQAKRASVFVLRFSFGYDFKHGFGGDRVDNGGKCWGLNQPQLEYLGINRDSVRSNFLNFDDRSMERVWQHPYWESVMREGEEKILREGKEAVDEEKQENPEKSKEGLGSEKEEGNWNDAFSVRSNFLNFNERSMERVRQHSCWEGTMCRGEEKILREEKKAVAEEKQENSKKSKGGSEEEEEEDLKVHTEEDKEDKASELRDPNKRPRTPDSEDVEAEGSFKRRRV